MNNKTVLMIAFEFPPSNGASVPRIESFYRYLKQWGWRVVVLTATKIAYEKINNEYTDSEGDLVYRAFALDAPRHLSIKGKYWSAMENPDRWGATWIPFALAKGRKLIDKYKPDVIWSSSPIPSTHFIASKLAAKSQTPWVADYRDPFHYMNGSAGKKLDKVHQKIDFETLSNASQLTFATAQVKDLYHQRYGEVVQAKSTVIENGYDEANFQLVQGLQDIQTPFSEGKFTLYYSGVLYQNGRDPKPIFQAIGLLREEGLIASDNFELIFQGAGTGSEYQDLLAEVNASGLVQFVDSVSFLKALHNMMHADALLLIQDTRFNKQIPGKIYEYLRTQRPMLVKADPQGATYQLAKQFEGVQLGYQVAELRACILALIENEIPGGFKRELTTFTRENKSKQLEQVLLSLL